MGFYLRNAVAPFAPAIVQTSDPANVMQYDLLRSRTSLPDLPELHMSAVTSEWLPSFNYYTGAFSAPDLASLYDGGVAANVWPVRFLSVSQYPWVTDTAGQFSVQQSSWGGQLNFTSTYWTRQLVGADVANSQGYNGAGVKVAVVDTGGTHFNVQTPTITKYTAVDGNKADIVGHGEWCLGPETLVYTSFCGVERIDVVYSEAARRFGEVQRDGGSSVNLEKAGIMTVDSAGVSKNVVAIHKNKVEPGHIHYTRTILGWRIATTPSHVFYLRSGGQKRADELTVGDILSVPEKLPAMNQMHVNGIELSPDWGYVIGWFVGDGSRRKESRSVCFKGSFEEMEHLRAIVEGLGFRCNPMRKETGAECYILSPAGEIALALDLLGVTNNTGLHHVVDPKPRTCQKDRVPSVIAKADEATIRAFVNGLIDSGGHVNNDSGGVDFLFTSQVLARQLVNLLLVLGIHASYTERTKSTSMSEYHANRVTVYADRMKLVDELGLKVHRIEPKDAGWRPVPGTITKIDVRDRDFAQWFYDLEVEGDHRFSSGSVGMFDVHNCISAIVGRSAVDHVYSTSQGKQVVCEGMAPGATGIEIKALDFGMGSGSNAQLLKAWQMALDLGVDVCSNSWGSATTETSADQDEFNTPLNTMVNSGMIVLCAAGNSGPNSSTIDTPGCLPNSLTVGAYNAVSNISPFGVAGYVCGFSSRGPTNWGDTKPDILAPGAVIDSAITGWMSSSYTGQAHPFQCLAGTSMATPHAAGIVTCMAHAHRELLNKALTTAEIKQMMAALSGSKDNSSGWGPISWSLYQKWLSTQYGIEVLVRLRDKSP
jgi:intein/homing endonuclease